MHRKFVSTLPAFVSFFCLASAAAAQDQVSLTLPQALKSAIERNLDLRAELYSPAMAEADIRKYRGIYNPKLKLNSGVDHRPTLSPRIIENEESISRTTKATAELELTTLLPFGGEVGAGFDNTYYNSNDGGAVLQNPLILTTIDKYWESELYVKFSQPLLKNFGRDNTEIDIRVAETEKEASLDRMRTRVLDLAADVNKQYYALHSVREDLAVKRASLALAQKVLDDTRARVKAGVLPAMEILNAEYGVAAREKDVIDADRAVRDQNDLLRVLLQLEEIGEIVPAEAPPKEPFTATVDADLKRTLENRPELKELRATIRSNELRTRNLRNLTLPDLSLEAQAGLSGLGEDYGSNLDRLASAKYPAWNVGLKFVYPLGNGAATNDYIRSKLKTEQLKTQLHSKEEAIGKEVRTAERGVSSAYKQLDVADRQRVAAEERLRAFLKKSEVGLATIKDVLEVENELTLARSNQIRAVVDYNNAVTTYLRATGDLLERDRINIGVGDTDRLYKNAKN